MIERASQAAEKMYKSQNIYNGMHYLYILDTNKFFKDISDELEDIDKKFKGI